MAPLSYRYWQCLAIGLLPLLGLGMSPKSFAAVEAHARLTTTTIAHTEVDVGAHLSKARSIMKELRTVIDRAAGTIELTDQLKAKRHDNDRLRRSISLHRAAKVDVERLVDPNEMTMAKLTGTIVDNWLETMRLRDRSDGMERRLLDKTRAWRSLEEKAAALRQELSARQAELARLKARSAELARILKQVRAQMTRTTDDLQRSKRHERTVLQTTDELRRDITRRLRAVILRSLTTEDPFTASH